MGRILILEPNAEIRELLQRVVGRLGHEPLVPARLSADGLGPIDAVLLEPAWAPALEFVDGLRERSPHVPIVFETIELTSPARASLRPAVYLVKPFTVRELEEAIKAAFA
jgi:DNA-binding response OmpR family regulator